MESTIAGLICAGVVVVFAIGFYIYLSIEVKNLQR